MSWCLGVGEEPGRHVKIFEGEARIGQMIRGMEVVQLRPEDFSSPVALQMALSRIYDAVLRMMQEGPKKVYVAEIRFNDDLGNRVVFAVELGETPPPFTKDKVKARIVVELFEEGGGEETPQGIPP
ncbi:hypothetical protein Pyrfu_1812 [Pyrolobus fumarii 1A]|uniref:Uncharacterized protein n=1 Tax=Pyrolobus fumarii (strain DSM 11204 / 1A) TaxID=694429 RepID=G0ECU6_PYRF1|nr:hypothetical protein [Pyrolobus fumarii]AEM39666.1 hypothetical protein Pyrfu_1812 [Pyrolobus fumarii 1A]